MISAFGVDHGASDLVEKGLDIGRLSTSAKLAVSRKARQKAADASKVPGGYSMWSDPDRIKRAAVRDLKRPFSTSNRGPERRGTLSGDLDGVKEKPSGSHLYRGIAVSPRDAKKMARRASRGKPIGDGRRGKGELKSFTDSISTAGRYGADATDPWRNTRVTLRAAPGSVSAKQHPRKGYLGESLVKDDLRGTGRKPRRTKSGGYVIDVKGNG